MSDNDNRGHESSDGEGSLWAGLSEFEDSDGDPEYDLAKDVKSRKHRLSSDEELAVHGPKPSKKVKKIKRKHPANLLEQIRRSIANNEPSSAEVTDQEAQPSCSHWPMTEHQTTQEEQQSEAEAETDEEDMEDEETDKWAWRLAITGMTCRYPAHFFQNTVNI